MNCVQPILTGELVIPITAGKANSEFWENTRLAVEMLRPTDATEPSRQRKDIRKAAHLASDEYKEIKGVVPEIGTCFRSLIPSFREGSGSVLSLLLQLSHPHNRNGERIRIGVLFLSLFESFLLQRVCSHSLCSERGVLEVVGGDG